MGDRQAAHDDHPLRIGYRLPRREAFDFAAMLERLGPESIARIRALSARRALPWEALVLERLAHGS